MKKHLLLIVFAALSVAAAAQPGHPRPEDLDDEEFVKMQVNDMAMRMNLNGETRERFILVYGNFRKDINSIMGNAKPAFKAETEEEIEKVVLRNFEISENILSIRREYYHKFREFMLPSQIRRMYSFENEAGRRMMDRPMHHAGPEDHGRPDAPGAPGNPHGPERPEGPGGSDMQW